MNLLKKFSLRTTHTDDLQPYLPLGLLDILCREQKTLIESLGKDPQALYNEDYKQLFCTPPPSLVTMPLPFAFSIIQHLMIKTMAEVYGFQTAPWTRSQDVSALRMCLQNHGPLVIGGRFGHAWYTQLPVARETVNGHPIWSWEALPITLVAESPTFVHQDVSSSTEQPGMTIIQQHMIVLIGASEEGFVYYVDPNDASDPNRPHEQKIYTIPYAIFVQNVADLRGRCAQPEEPDSPFGYAWYFPTWLHLEQTGNSHNRLEVDDGFKH